MTNRADNRANPRAFGPVPGIGALALSIAGHAAAIAILWATGALRIAPHADEAPSRRGEGGRELAIRLVQPIRFEAPAPPRPPQPEPRPEPQPERPEPIEMSEPPAPRPAPAPPEAAVEPVDPAQAAPQAPQQEPEPPVEKQPVETPPPAEIVEPSPAPPPPARKEPAAGVVCELEDPDSIAPVYPRSCRLAGHEGVSLVRIDLDAGGRVLGVRLLEGAGCAELDGAALEAARRARFRPPLLDGKPAAATVELPIRFRLR